MPSLPQGQYANIPFRPPPPQFGVPQQFHHQSHPGAPVGQYPPPPGGHYGGMPPPGPAHSGANFNRLPINKPPDPIMMREMQFRDQVFAETMMTNKSLVASMQQTNQMTLECIQTITGMMGPLLRSTEKENKKLKRMLSERHGVNEDNILDAEISTSTRRFQKQKDKEKSDNEQEDFNEVLSQKSEKKEKKTFKPAGKTF